MTQTADHTGHAALPTTVRLAAHNDVIACKRIADQHRAAFGFLVRAVFEEAIVRRRLLVAITSSGDVAGFLRFNHRRRGTETALYDIGVDPRMQGQGIGRSLVAALAANCRANGRSTIVLKCPEGLPANGFYERLGFKLCGVEVGRRRSLRVWRRAAEDEPWSL